jgi:hypothetical protein
MLHIQKQAPDDELICLKHEEDGLIGINNEREKKSASCLSFACIYIQPIIYIFLLFEYSVRPTVFTENYSQVSPLQRFQQAQSFDISDVTITNSHTHQSKKIF